MKLGDEPESKAFCKFSKTLSIIVSAKLGKRKSIKVMTVAYMPPF